MPAAPTLDWLPGADLSRRYDGKYPGGIRRDVEKLLLHSTETRPEWGCPGYSNGGAAPNLTVSPWRKHRFVFQHFPLTMSARALVDSDSTTVRENRDGVPQIELVGYSDAQIAKANGGYDLRTLDDEELRWLAATLAPIVVAFGIPLVRPPLWPSYPESYGATSARLSGPDYDAFRGILGHLHAPGNAHGDPSFPVDRWMLMIRNVIGAGPVDTGGLISVPVAPVSPPAAPEPDSQKPAPAAAWDGRTFPGASAFQLGQSHPAVTVLGQRLTVHGFGGGYQVGPGPRFSETDRAATADFQKSQGWTGDDADGYPGPSTWTELMAAPAKAAPTKTPTQKPPPPAPSKETAVSKFPGTSFMTNGRTSDDALLVGRALVAAGYSGYKVGPSKTWGPADTRGVEWFQKKLGNTVDGKLGPKQWAALLEELDTPAKSPSKPKGDPGTGQFYVDVDVLNGRVSASEKASRKWTRTKGTDIDVVETKHAEGRWWSSTGKGGAWYASEHLTRTKPKGNGPAGKPASNGSASKYVRPITQRGNTPITQGWDVKSNRYASKEHNGVDIAAPHGEPIMATIGGVVVSYRTEGAYGQRMVVRGDDGLLWAYNHTSARVASVGSRVRTGEVIARVGATGNVTGPHLCLEAYPNGSTRYNTDVNPNRWP